MTMKWKLQPKIKIYEALGCVADGRIELIGKNEARVYSSSRGKFYVVKYDAGARAIMANDNGSYWRGYLGYPAIAFLMSIGVMSFDARYAEALKDIAWKDINMSFKNDFEKTEKYIHDILRATNVSLEGFLWEVDDIMSQIETLDLSLLGKKVKPPIGY